MNAERRDAWRQSVAVRNIQIDGLAEYGKQSPAHRQEVLDEIARRIDKYRAKFDVVIERIG